MITLQQSPKEFRAFESTPGTSVIVLPDSPNFTLLAASDDFIDLTGLPKDEIIGESYFKLFPGNGDISLRGNAELQSSFDFVIKNKSRHEIPCFRHDLQQRNESVTRYWNIRNAPVYAESGELLYIIHTLVDITASILAEQKIASASGMEKAYRFFMQAPVVIGHVRGSDYEIDLANDDLLKVWKVNRDVIGKRLFDVFPELEQQGFKTLLDEVRKTGKPFTAYEFPISFERNGNEQTYFFDFVYQPYFEGDEKVASGVIAVGHDVTEQVNAKRLQIESQKRWKDLANSMPVIVWTTDPDGRMNFINDHWYELTGLNESQSLGYGWTNALHPDDKEKCIAAWNTARENEQFYEMEVRYKTRNGNYIWTIVRGIPIRENGNIIAWYGTSTDIDELKKLENELEQKVREGTREVFEKKKLLDSILTHSSNGISVSEMIFDAEGNVIDAQTIIANDAAVNFSGIPKDLYVTKPASFFDPNIIPSDYGQACIKTLRTGEPFIMRYFLDFSKKWLELTVSRMDERHLIHIFTDVTSIRDAQSKLEKTLEDLRFSNANLEEFTYAASHDLKEPIRKYQFYTNRLKEDLKDKLDQKQLAVLERLESTSLRMSNLVNDLLEYSQASKGASEHEDLHLTDIINGVIEDLELEIQKRQAQISFDSLPSLSGNRRQIHQLFQNLISNALKYSDPHKTPKINLRASLVKGKDVSFELPQDVKEKTFHLIQAQDNGIGFDQKDAERIFKVFTRLHSGSHYRGSGVGLSIVKKVVEGHHGFVWAESKVGEGATFSILLPARVFGNVR